MAALCVKFLGWVITLQVNQIVQTSIKLGNSKTGVKILIKEIQQDLWGGQASIFGVRVLNNGQLSHTVECRETDVLSVCHVVG